jgi:hypothetical protein
VDVDVGVGHEPVPDAREDAHRLAEEERGLALVLEHERRDESRLGHHVPEDE